MSALESPGSRLRGNVFGRYRLLASLGQGGMADVFLAVVEGMAGINKLQVIKRLRRNLVDEQEFLMMFLDEARLAARLNHPNVVQTIEVGQVDADYFIAMEYLDGQPLNRILHAVRTRPPPPGLVLQIIADALSGLHYAHELTDYDGAPLNIVHRDTSPHNIFVTYEGQTKLVDFGIAKASRRTNETSAGTIKGKFAYMSPEQALSSSIDRRGDVFVMGLVLWEVVTGQKIWKGLADMEIVHRIVSGKIPRFDAEPLIPAELARIGDRALARQPEDRYATAAEMRRDLLAYMEGAKLHVPAETISEYLTTVFALRRAEMRKVIEHQLIRVEPTGDAMQLAPASTRSPNSSSLPELGGTLASADAEATPSGESKGGTLMASSPPTQPEPTVPARASRTWVVVGAAIALAIGGLYVGLGRSGAGAHTDAAAITAAAAQPVAPSPPSVAKIALRIHADPESAQLFLDDAALPANPFTGSFAADGLGHRLRIEAAGYTPRVQLVVFDKDSSVDVALAASAAAPLPSGPTRAAGRLVGASPTGTPNATTAAQPGQLGPPGTRDRRPLEDPWAEGAKPATAPKRTLDSADPFGH